MLLSACPRTIFRPPRNSFQAGLQAGYAQATSERRGGRSSQVQEEQRRRETRRRETSALNLVSSVLSCSSICGLSFLYYNAPGFVYVVTLTTGRHTALPALSLHLYKIFILVHPLRADPLHSFVA